MKPDQALEFLLDVAKRAVMVDSAAGRAGLTFADHVAMAEAENVLRAALTPPEGAENAKTKPKPGKGKAHGKAD